MADGNSKEDQASTSAKENERDKDTDGEGLRRRDADDESRNGRSSESSFGSLNNQLLLARSKHKMPKKQLLNQLRKKQQVTPQKKKKVIGGRVEKQPSRRQPKKQTKRKAVRPKAVRKRRISSSSTAFTALSSVSNSVSEEVCKYCGHRCCLRRFEEKWKSFRKSRQKKNVNATKRRTKASECIQAGSTSLMLSSLCENRDTVPTLDTSEIPEERLYCEITPEMIHQALRRITMWRNDVPTMSILEYLKHNYPVSQDVPVLLEELSNKLNVAELAGIVEHTSADRWRLAGPLQDRQLSPTHVSIFWTIYVDTMSPITKKDPLRKDNEDPQTNDDKDRDGRKRATLKEYQII